MDKYVQEAMDIANDRTQSIFQQKNEFERLIEAIKKDSVEKYQRMLAEQRRAEEMEDLRYLPRM